MQRQIDQWIWIQHAETDPKLELCKDDIFFEMGNDAPINRSMDVYECSQTYAAHNIWKKWIIKVQNSFIKILWFLVNFVMW